MEERNKLKNKINKMNIKINKIKELEEQNKLLKNEIEKYKSEYINKDITFINPGEKIMTINFVSMGNQEISNYSIPCKNTDLFVRLEEKLYNDFPKYKDYETYFEVNTKRIKRFKTLEENNIKSNDIISIFLGSN